jgi:hypothetical protein
VVVIFLKNNVTVTHVQLRRMSPIDDEAPARVAGDASTTSRTLAAILACFTLQLQLLSAAQRAFELYADGEVVRRELHDFGVPCVARQPAKRRRARYEDRRDLVTCEELHGNAKWFRAWRESTYAQYYALEDSDGYEQNMERDVVLRKEFEKKIRMPLRLFHRLRNEMSRDPWFEERHTAVPLEIKLVAALRYLAVGGGWQVVEDIVNVSRQVLRTWFAEKFVPWMLEHKYEANVRYPEDASELAVLMQPYEEAGFPGCIGCVDGVHVDWKGYPAADKWRYVGKEKRPTLVANCTTDYWGRFIHVTRMLPGSDNDKSAICQDDFQSRVMREDDTYVHAEYRLQTDLSTVITRKGVYVLADGGYLGWPTTVSPIAHPRPGSAEENWNKHHESLRKSVECAFGILKARFRVLATRNEARDENEVSDVFRVCCCLHNMIYNFRMAERMEQETSAEISDWRRMDAEELECLHRHMPTATTMSSHPTPSAVDSVELRQLQLQLASHNTFYMYARATVEMQRRRQNVESVGLDEHRARAMWHG